MGRLQQRLVTGVVVLGVLTALSVVVADLGSPDEVEQESLAPHSEARPTAAVPSVPSPPTNVTPGR